MFFWFYVVIDNSFTHITDVTLRLVNKPEALILMSRVPSSVRVEFRGTGKAFFSYAFRDRRIELDLHPVLRSSWMRLSVDMVKDIPPGMDLHPVRIVSPDSLFIELDHYAIKRMRVRPDIDVHSRDGFVQVDEVEGIPDSVTVSGPRSMLDGFSEVRTKRLEFRESEGEISGKVPLLLRHPDILRYSDRIVKYRVDVQRLGERKIDGVPVRVLHVPAGVKPIVVPSTLSLTLQGGVDVLARLNLQDVSAVVDYQDRHGISGNRYSALIRLPQNIVFSDVQPKVFELIIEK
jgi:YbbR domain-containing protein